MLFVLDKKEKMVGVLNNLAPLSCPYFDDIHTENIETGVNTYEFTVPANHAGSEKLEDDGYIIFKDLDGRMQMFQIKDIEEIGSSTYEKRIYSEHIAIPELLACPFRPQKLVGLSLKKSLDLVLQGTGWELGEYSWEGIVDNTFDEYISVLEALYTIVETFDAEIEYEVVFVNGVVTKRLIHVTKQRGKVTNKRFTYGKDLAEVKRVVNSEGIITALIGVGKGDTDGSRLTLSGYNPDSDSQKEALPKGFIKPISADWVGSEEALQNYGKNGRHLFGVFVDDSAENIETLLMNTLRELKVRAKPKVTYEMRVAMLERVAGMNTAAEKTRIGDTIIADDSTFSPRLLVEARIVEMKRSYTQPEADECTLGDYRPIRITNNVTIEKLQQIISANEAIWNAVTYSMLIDSTGGNVFKNGIGTTTLRARIFRGDKEVDTDGTEYVYRWYKRDKDGNTDASFVRLGKTLTVTGNDVTEKATFLCEVDEIDY